MEETKPYPPKFFLRFFRGYCHPRLADDIEGDLIEVYRKRARKNGKRNADIRFVIDVLLLFRPGIIRPAKGYKNLNNYGMYKSYFKIGWRNLGEKQSLCFINISGLVLGVASSLVIMLWVVDEKGIDAFHENNDQPLYCLSAPVLRWNNQWLIRHAWLACRGSEENLSRSEARHRLWRGRDS